METVEKICVALEYSVDDILEFVQFIGQEQR